MKWRGEPEMVSSDVKALPAPTGAFDRSRRHAHPHRTKATFRPNYIRNAQSLSHRTAAGSKERLRKHARTNGAPCGRLGDVAFAAAVVNAVVVG